MLDSVCFKFLLALFISTMSLSSTCRGQEGTKQTNARMAEFSGPTMGTRFTVKIYDPPSFEDDVRLEVDAKLRHINDLMSTYLPNSEISRFNQSDSVDWFPVNLETASVVTFAQAISEKTGGAFDITVGPLVNAWSFGPAERKRVVPTQKEIDEILSGVGYKKLEVKLNPPALRKTEPNLEIDLSSIAKGYAVDQVVLLLNRLGAENVFVEIGGEVCTSGSKAGQPWQVGIQVPDIDQDAVLIAQPLNTQPKTDQAMATSGDYRNFFEVDGKRYSHTIDPRSGFPIEHGLASVSILSSSCMEADAWATALNVLGDQEGGKLAKSEGLSLLAVKRNKDGYTYLGNGLLQPHADSLSEAATLRAAGSSPTASKLSTTPKKNASWLVMLLTAAVFGIIVTGMAVGVMFGRRAISGSCGGLANRTDADGNTSCSLCSNPSDACKELRDRMNDENTQQNVGETGT